MAPPKIGVGVVVLVFIQILLTQCSAFHRRNEKLQAGGGCADSNPRRAPPTITISESDQIMPLAGLLGSHGYMCFLTEAGTGEIFRYTPNLVLKRAASGLWKKKAAMIDVTRESVVSQVLASDKLGRCHALFPNKNQIPLGLLRARLTISDTLWLASSFYPDVLMNHGIPPPPPVAKHAPLISLRSSASLAIPKQKFETDKTPWARSVPIDIPLRSPKKTLKKPFRFSVGHTKNLAFGFEEESTLSALLGPEHQSESESSKSSDKYQEKEEEDQLDLEDFEQQDVAEDLQDDSPTTRHRINDWMHDAEFFDGETSQQHAVRFHSKPSSVKPKQKTKSKSKPLADKLEEWDLSAPVAEEREDPVVPAVPPSRAHWLFFVQIYSAVGCLSLYGISHRDLKPDNVMVDFNIDDVAGELQSRGTPFPVVMDFGAADFAFAPVFPKVTDSEFELDPYKITQQSKNPPPEMRDTTLFRWQHLCAPEASDYLTNNAVHAISGYEAPPMIFRTQPDTCDQHLRNRYLSIPTWATDVYFAALTLLAASAKRTTDDPKVAPFSYFKGLLIYPFAGGVAARQWSLLFCPFPWSFLLHRAGSSSLFAQSLPSFFLLQTDPASIFHFRRADPAAGWLANYVVMRSLEYLPFTRISPYETLLLTEHVPACFAKFSPHLLEYADSELPDTSKATAADATLDSALSWTCPVVPFARSLAFMLQMSLVASPDRAHAARVLQLCDESNLRLFVSGAVWDDKNPNVREMYLAPTRELSYVLTVVRNQRPEVSGAQDAHLSTLVQWIIAGLPRFLHLPVQGWLCQKMKCSFTLTDLAATATFDLIHEDMKASSTSAQAAYLHLENSLVQMLSQICQSSATFVFAQAQSIE